MKIRTYAEQDGPLAVLLMDAMDAAKIAEQAYDDGECGDDRAMIAAQGDVNVALAALLGSDEDVEWEVSEEGNVYTTVWAASAREALEIAATDHDASCYGDVEETFRVTIRVTSDLIGETDTDTVTIDPAEPSCTDGHDHDWQWPHSVVGGCESNPGVWCSDHGQVRIKCACSHCGVYQTTDHGGTDANNGTRLTTTSYDDADDDSLGWIADGAAESLSTRSKGNS